MKQKRGCLLVFTFLLLSWLTFGISVHVAKAEDETPTTTPTPNWQPLFPTNTAVPTENYACPESNPDGWGTVTPDPYWLMQCANCVDRMPIPPTATTEPTAGPSPTVAPTPTVNPGADLHVYWIEEGLPNTQMACYSWGCIGNFPVTVPPNDNNQVIVGWMFGGHTGTIPNCIYKWATDAWYNANAGLDVSNDYLIGSKNGLYLSDAKVNELLPGHASRRYTYFWQWDTPWDATYNVEMQATASCIGHLEDWWLAFIYKGTELEEEETGPSYCDEVEGDLGGGGDDDIGSWLPTILVAQGSCTQILGWELDLSVLNLIPGIDDLDTVTLPGFNLCVNPIQFGSVKIFDITVDLDIFAFLAAGLVILRILLRS